MVFIVVPIFLKFSSLLPCSLFYSYVKNFSSIQEHIEGYRRWRKYPWITWYSLSDLNPSSDEDGSQIQLVYSCQHVRLFFSFIVDKSPNICKHMVTFPFANISFKNIEWNLSFSTQSGKIQHSLFPIYRIQVWDIDESVSFKCGILNIAHLHIICKTIPFLFLLKHFFRVSICLRYSFRGICVYMYI